MKISIIKLSVLLLSFSLFTACSQSRFMDLGGFVYNFNRVSDEEIDFEDVYIYNDESDSVYEIFLGETQVVLKLIAEAEQIKQVRIAMAKVNEKGEAVNIDSETISTFIKTAENTIRAWCSFDEHAAIPML